MLSKDSYARLRYRLLPDHVIGEVLSKSWIDNVVPALAVATIVGVISLTLPSMFTLGSLVDISREFSELALIAIAMMIVILAGGIDLSVGSVYALSAMSALYTIIVLHWPFPLALAATIAIGMVCGAINGFLIGYLRLRAFLTTLVTLVIYRSIYELIFPRISTDLVTGTAESASWDFLNFGTVYGIPPALIISVGVVALAHIVISRTRPGWQLTAVGGARRSAYNAGINVRFVVFTTYIVASALCAIAGFLFAARLGSVGPNAGLGMEIVALTAVVAGGCSLGGGRGSVVKALLGAIFVLFLSNLLIRSGFPGGVNTLVLGVTLIAAVIIDMRWVKNRTKLLNKVYTSPTYLAMPTAAPTAEGSGSPYEMNSKLEAVELICPGELDGPEDVILDDNDNIYFGGRQGDIVRILAPDYKQHEVFAHIGGRPLGMAFDQARNLIVAVASMGLYQVSPDRKVNCLTAETNRSWTSVVDDSRISHADDLDIAPDGKVYFSDSTTRYTAHNWAGDALEGRGNGRILRYDPKTGKTRTILRGLVFTNGVCMAHDNKSFFFAETWACRIRRYWLEGPKAGKLEIFIDDLPGLPDNINRASDGTYWLAMLGMRTDTLDLAMRMPGFRARMVRRVAPDEWLFPNLNTGGVVKFDEQANILDALWDPRALNHPMVTSMREHKGWLYLGGLSNDRIGRYRLNVTDRGWSNNGSYWGAP